MEDYGMGEWLTGSIKVLRGSSVKLDDQTARAGFDAFCNAAELHAEFIIKYKNFQKPELEKIGLLTKPQGKISGCLQ